jgi:hypothetical protein
MDGATSSLFAFVWAPPFNDNNNYLMHAGWQVDSFVAAWRDGIHKSGAQATVEAGQSELPPGARIAPLRVLEHPSLKSLWRTQAAMRRSVKRVMDVIAALDCLARGHARNAEEREEWGKRAAAGEQVERHPPMTPEEAWAQLWADFRNRPALNPRGCNMENATASALAQFVPKVYWTAAKYFPEHMESFTDMTPWGA